MRKSVLTSFIVILSFALYSQEKQMASEKFKIGLSAVNLNYIGYNVNTQGYRLDVGIPIYRELSANLNFSQFDSYFDYCGEIPVQVDELHFVPGLSYMFLERRNWSLNVLAGLDIERTTYKEVEELPKDASVFQEARVHEHGEDHNYSETFIEGVLGVEASFMLSKHFYLNASSRINTYSAFHNSMGVGYTFGINK